jgi:uncharacterized protein Veg
MYHAQAATHIDSLKIQIRCHTDIEVALQTQPGEKQSHRQGILQHNKTMFVIRHGFINVLRSREIRTPTLHESPWEFTPCQATFECFIW